MELDDGKILTGNPDQFDGKLTMGFRFRFSQQNQSIAHWPFNPIVTPFNPIVKPYYPIVIPW